MNFNFIIVGAGSAGCVLANKLTKNPNNRVLLIEAGPSDNKLLIKLPIGYGSTFYDSRINWCYESDNEKNLNDRKIYWPRGKVIGGSSSINGLVYHRGQESDYNDWEKAGNPGWSYKSLVPFFNEFEEIDKVNSKLNGNKLSISYVEKEYHPLKSIFYQTCEEAKIKFSVNSFIEGEGVGPYYINTFKGMRCSSAKAFLKPIMGRKNLKIIKNSLVNQIIIKDKKAIGVKVQNIFDLKDIKTYLSTNEVILSAGAINSPQLLQLSGIGPSKTLKKNGINIIYDNPNVGKNLQDHLGISYYLSSKSPTLNQVFGDWKGRMYAALRYIINQKGPFSVGVNHIGGLLKTSQDFKNSNMQVYFNPHSYQIQFKNERRLFSPDRSKGFNISYNSCRPYSQGTVEINSSNINDSPSIKPNYLSHQKDIDNIIKMSRFIGKLQNTNGIKSILSDNSHLQLNDMSDAELIDDFKNRASTVFHPCGTCKMSSDKKNSVVDSNLKVHGIENLRVVDASVFPNITSANINAPTIMLAHKGAKIILNQ